MYDLQKKFLRFIKYKFHMLNASSYFAVARVFFAITESAMILRSNQSSYSSWPVGSPLALLFLAYHSG